MLAQTKRRRISLLSLPVVVVTGFLLVARLAAWQRSDLIADLTDCVAHGETSEARDAVRKLAAMPSPPIPVLVTAAAADEHETAETAQLAINRLLGRWQRDIEARQRVGAVSDQLSELTRSLAERHSEFSESDHTWLASTAARILRLANTFPRKKTPLVAIHCDVIIAAVADHGLTPPPGASHVATSHGAATSSNDRESVGPKVGANDPNAAATLEQVFSAHTPQPFPNANEPAEPLKKEKTSSPGAHFKPTSPDNNESITNPGGDPLGVTGSLPNAIDPPSGQVPPSPEASGPAEWSQPMFRISPPVPANIQPTDRNETAPAKLNVSLGIVAAESLGDVSSRELLRNWLARECVLAVLIRGTAIGPRINPTPAVIGIAVAGLPAQNELARRGFGLLTIGIVRQYFSTNPDGRMQLVDYVLSRPGAGAGAWLLLLADDADADVRLFAVTLMATSNDAALLEKAWQVALRDRDPRIAELANRLRERRAGTLRR